MKPRKLTNAEAMHVLNLKYSLGKSYRAIAEIYNVTDTVIWQICHRVTYQDVHDAYCKERARNQ